MSIINLYNTATHYVYGIGSTVASVFHSPKKKVFPLEKLPKDLIGHIGGFVDTPLAYLRTSKTISKQAEAVLVRNNQLVSELLPYHGMVQQMQKGYFGSNWQATITELDLQKVFKTHGEKSSEYNDTLLQTIVDTFPSLQKLHLRSNLFTRSGLEQFTRLSQLEELDLTFEELTEEMIQVIAKMKTVKRLISNRHYNVKHFSRLRHLEELIISSASVTDQSIQHIVKMKKLRKLVCKFWGNRDKLHKKLPKLVVEDGRDCPWWWNYRWHDLEEKMFQWTDKFKHRTKETIENLTKMPLRKLELCSRFVDDSDLQHIAQIRTLQMLDLSSCERVTDAGLAQLVWHTKLKELSLHPRTVKDLSLWNSLRIAPLRKYFPDVVRRTYDTFLSKLKEILEYVFLRKFLEVSRLFYGLCNRIEDIIVYLMIKHGILKLPHIV